MAINLI